MRFRFAECEIDLDSHDFIAAGERRALEPQVFDLVAYLAQHPGRLISRDELVDVIWQGRIVSESTISARINAVRRAVNDDGVRQSVVATIPRRGVKMVAEVEVLRAAATGPLATSPVPASQKISFCQSRDGTGIAFAQHGDGPPLVRAGHWLTHLEHDWRSPVWRPFLDALGAEYRVTRYDQRGCGLSDPEPGRGSLEDYTDDLEAVVDGAGLDRFALYGTSQGAPIAVAFAVRRPERVSHLVLHGGYAQGRLVRASEAEREYGRALLALIRHGWGQPEGPFIQAFTSLFLPGGTPEQIASLTAMQRMSATPENAVAIREAVDKFDASTLLAQVTVPTLVIHARNDGVQPLAQGRMLAAGIPGASFVMLESANHVILTEDPAFETLMGEMRNFLKSR